LHLFIFETNSSVHDVVMNTIISIMKIHGCTRGVKRSININENCNIGKQKISEFDSYRKPSLIEIEP